GGLRPDACRVSGAGAEHSHVDVRILVQRRDWFANAALRSRRVVVSVLGQRAAPDVARSGGETDARRQPRRVGVLRAPVDAETGRRIDRWRAVQGMTTPTLGRVLATLRRCYGKPANPPTRDPFQMILWEQVGYLVTDAQRRVAFDALRTEVGLSADAIAAASDGTLHRIARLGGHMAADSRGNRLRQ